MNQKIIYLFILLSISIKSISQEITITVMDALTLERCNDCNISISSKKDKYIRLMTKTNNNEFVILFRNSITVSPSTNKTNYFGGFKTFSSKSGKKRDTLWIFPNAQLEKEIFASNKCIKSNFSERKVNKDAIDVDVDGMARFKGDFKKFLSKNMFYPHLAMELGDQGKVWVEFIVEKDGSISCPTILKSVSQELDAETLRVIRLMPNWTPATIDDEVVRTRCRIPISFILQ